MKPARILLIIPCYNEQRSIAALLNEITEVCPDCKILVIDDGSDDDTFHIAQALAPTVQLLKNLGIGGAVQTGIKYAYSNGFDFCIQIDGDGQHPPSEVAKLLQAYRAKSQSIIIGSRYLCGGTFNSTRARRFGGRAIAMALNTLFSQCSVTDPTSGMRLMDRKSIAFFAKHYPHDFPEPISLAWALKEGLSVSEVPVLMRDREHGNSSIVGLMPIAYMLRVIGYILLARLKRHSLN